MKITPKGLKKHNACRMTHWDKWIKILQDNNVPIRDIGGIGFVLPRLAKINNSYICKVKDLKKLAKTYKIHI